MTVEQVSREVQALHGARSGQGLGGRGGVNKLYAIRRSLLPASSRRDSISVYDIRLAIAETPAELEDACALLAEAPPPHGDLPSYLRPHGLLLLGYLDGEPVGCAAFRPRRDLDDPDTCELHVLYVRQAMRRFGLGRALAQALIDQARQAGYATMVLDTHNDTEAARGLYASLGFEAIAPYEFSAQGGAHCLQLDLNALGSRY